MLAERVKQKEKDDKRQREWQMAARIFNKFFLFLYMLTVFLTLAGVYLTIPKIFDQQSEYSLMNFDDFKSKYPLSEERIEPYHLKIAPQ